MKKIRIVFTALLCTFTLSACNTAGTLKENTEEDLIKIEESVKQDVSEADEISKEKIDEALTYIHENIDKIKEKDGKIAKKVYEYSIYLEESAKKGTTALEHDITSFASKSKTYAKNAYTSTEAEIEKIAEEGEAELKSLGDAIHEEKDSLVEEFHKLINK